MSEFSINNLDTPSIGELLGKGIVFSIESYQRGYRWKEAQVIKLLEDVYKANEHNSRQPYMLQPIVLNEKGRVTRDDGTKEFHYELIDGQQRLTCIWLILQYLKKAGIADEDGYYTLTYKTRGSGKYLEELANGGNPSPESIDEEHFERTYKCVDGFFSQLTKTDKFAWLTYLLRQVRVIWYVIDDALSEKKAEDIFMSLNRGRIPLTDSELVKTLLLVRTIIKDEKYKIVNENIQIEIGMQWDEMEHHLADNDFWAFIAGDYKSAGKPRMDYLLSVLPPPSGKKWNDSFDDDFKIFNRYADLLDDYEKEMREKEANGEESPPVNKYIYETLWRRHIRAGYLRLCDWAADVALFHKIGFLIAIQPEGDTELRINLLNELLALDKSKSELEEEIDTRIKKSIKKNGKKDEDGENDEETLNLENLSYKKDYDIMEKLLILYNVTTCMEEAKKARSNLCERYSFARHFDSEQPWSLEHINPQKEMRTLTGKSRTDRNDWFNWLMEHEKYLDIAKGNMGEEDFKDLKERVGKAITDGISKLTETTFKDLYKKIVTLFNADFDELTEDQLWNMALLRKDQNSSLGASIFIVKRSKVTGFVSTGQFVPICTRRVFLKYYTDDQLKENGNVTKFSFALWTKDDAKGYLEEIRKRLEQYLPSTNA